MSYKPSSLFVFAGVTMRDLKQPRALETRERILQEAARLFALKGYHDTKLEEIQSAAEVTTGALFHHFGGKEDLGFAVLDWHMEKRRQALDEIERQMPPSREDDPLGRVFRRLDAIQAMLGSREQSKGGCVIGNLSTALSDTHEAFRRRLASCFDEMAQEFKPHLDGAAGKSGSRRDVDTWDLARYIVAIIEGSIMLARTHGDPRLVQWNFASLKEYLRQIFVD